MTAQPYNSLNPKRSLVLAGGGMRVAYQAGVVMALEEEGLEFHHVDGTSGGIFNTAMLASGATPSQMVHRWKTLKLKWFSSLLKAKEYLKPLKMRGLADADGIADKVFPHMKIDLLTINGNNNGITYTFNVCNFSDKTIEAIPHDVVLKEHLLAGVSLPMFMPAFEIGDAWYTDAVWIKDANLVEAVKRGSKELWLVWAIGNTSQYLPGAFNQYVHMIEMSAGGAILEEFAQIRATDVKLHVIKPEYPLPLDPDFFFDKIDARSLINMGYANAKKYISEKSESGVQLDEKATKMKYPGDNLNLRCSFSGYMNFMGTSTEVDVHCYYQYISEKDELHIYASLEFDKSGVDHSLYNAHTTVTRDANRPPIWKTTATFNYQKTAYELQLEVPLAGAADTIIGLGFKTAHLHVTDHNGVISSAVLHQSIRSRLKHALRLNLLMRDGSHGSIFKKYQILSKLNKT
ncbi:patatin-like phospholipase family protein [Fulvivirga sp. RKSG066]|uniref:patatin-like phospholipase family protein n=1 Tax=Fulvivirga aurantia TaxID=2529383 RepID=UPI0012BC452D|nr:patatin-like phospholipase family protein [Fulvivirga aurantia]MTI23154.1 patatin-like phospholipase family protein [Fulvivirga aurantia]